MAANFRNLVVFLLLALWSRVDFTARLLQPWANMKNGPASAERSVFLDLITPIWPAAFVKSFKTGSLVPILTISGAAILNVVVSQSNSLSILTQILISSRYYSQRDCFKLRE
jgi:Na+/H+-dicarboxylate symporter